MLIIGEKLNSAIPSVRQLINDKDAARIQELARRQVEAGADYLDLNTSHCNEVPDMQWLIETVQEVSDIPLCIDSTSPEAVKAALQTARGKVMINSISLERDRLDGVLPLVLEYRCPVIGLTTDDSGIPRTAAHRIRLAERLVELLSLNKYDLSGLYVDPLVLPVAVEPNSAVMFFECLTEIKRSLNVKTVSGLSNISYNMPMRKIINRHFLTICMAFGMDAAILDPLDSRIMTAVTTTNLLLGKDRFGRAYLKAYRNNALVV